MPFDILLNIPLTTKQRKKISITKKCFYKLPCELTNNKT